MLRGRSAAGESRARPPDAARGERDNPASLSTPMQTTATTTAPPDISVVVPVYNNARTLTELVDRLVRVVDELGVAVEMLFVDDGSTDDSAALLADRAARDPR